MQHIIKIQIMQKTPTMHKTKVISGMNIIYVRQFFWKIHFSSLAGLLNPLEPLNLFFPSTSCLENFLSWGAWHSYTDSHK